MYNITDSILMSRVDILDTFVEGENYFKNNLIKTVKTNSEKTYFEGRIYNRSENIVKIRFKSDGNIKYTNCNCIDYKKNLGDCKHIIALFYFIREFEKNNKIKAREKEDLRTMISQYSNFEEERTYLLTEYNLDFKKNSAGSIVGASLTIRIGENRLYLIRDINEFFALEGREEIEFGKFFTYNPSIHRFKPRDKKIFKYLKRIYQGLNYYLDENKRKILEEKYIFLPDLLLREFLDLLGESNLNISIEGKVYKDIKIIKSTLPLSMDIKEEDGELIISLKGDEEILFLTSDSKYALVSNKIIKLKDEVRKKIIPIYEQVAVKGEGEVKIPEEYRGSYISNVLRNVNEDIELNFSKKVEKMLYREELIVEIYFDYIDGSIIGKIDFNYGKLIINPFSSRVRGRLNSNKILIRDSMVEEKVLSILEEGYFKVVDGGIYLDKDDEIYHLVSEIIPKLQEYSKVYYSESFKNIKINKSNIVSSLSIDKELDLLEFSFSLDGVNIDELEDILDAVKDKKKYYRLKDGSFLPLDKEMFKDFQKMIDEFEMNIYSDRINIPKYMGIYIDDYIDRSSLKSLKIDQSFKDFIRNIREEELINHKLPKSLDGVLRNYQKEGFNWLKTMTNYGLGGILADDMGLGKTLQVISFLLSEKEEKGRATSLIVVPTSILYNWENEIEKFAKDKLSTLIIQGDKEERRKEIRKINEVDIVITSYPLLRNDIEVYRDYNFRFLILDEAQNIKNSNSKNAKSVKLIRAKNKFALTGTPMENTLLELWSIFDFLMPGYLFTRKKFIDLYEKPIFKDKNKSTLKNLNRKIKPFILRRLKRDVLTELPEKIEQKVLVDMTCKQKEVYLSYIKNLRNEIFTEIQERGYSRSHLKILTGLTRLRQICCDPSLFLNNYQGGSGKLESLDAILEEALPNGHRILIFSQFTSMLDIIELGLKNKGISYMYLNGSTPTEERNEMVNLFNKGSSEVFLISLKAGGSGLNLIGADTVIHFDPWWNPAVEDQATDRAYRIGQENRVQVIKLITRGTIEEKIFDIQEEKKEMIDLVIKEGESLISKLSEDELLSLFEL